LSKGILLTLPTGEGAPQGFEGMGSWINGGWGKVPQQVWTESKVFAMLRHGSVKPKSVADPY